MNADQMKELVKSGKMNALEQAWSQAASENVPPAQMAAVLEALVSAGKTDNAEALAWGLVAEKTESNPQAALELAKAFLPPLPNYMQLRQQTADLYKTVMGTVANFQAIMKAAGLTGTQSPRRALRTLDICLAVKPGMFLANKYDGTVLKAQKFNEIMDEFELTDASGDRHRLDPKNLADEYDPVDEGDFRVMCQHRPEELGKMLAGDHATVLIGICTMHGGAIDSGALKDMLAPKYIATKDWADWWSKARTAAKRCPNLNLEGRNPVTIIYHAGGLTLEQEMHAAAASAKTPLEKLAVLGQYVREARDRKLEIQQSFTNPLVGALAEQASAFRDNRPADALAASLATEAVTALGIAKPTVEYPQAKETIAAVTKPAAAIAELADTPLWEAGLDVLSTRPDAADQLELLMDLAPADHLDDVAARLLTAGREQSLPRLASQAASDPLNHLELLIWQWKGPAAPAANVLNKVELLSRILKLMLELEHDWNVPPSKRKTANQRLRAALSASDCGVFKQAVSQMDEAVAGTIKRLIERAGGISQALRENLMSVLRENFYNLFVKARIEPWKDQTVIYTTERSLDKRQADMKELVEVKMLENARAIGVAAAHGDLSENSEWKFALEERDMLRARAAKMQDEIARARVITHDTIPADSVGVGSKLVLRKNSDNSPLELTFLGPWDSDLDHNVFSYQTQLAQDLMGCVVGDNVSVRLGDNEDDYTIEAILPGI